MSTDPEVQTDRKEGMKSECTEEVSRVRGPFGGLPVLVRRASGTGQDAGELRLPADGRRRPVGE